MSGLGLVFGLFHWSAIRLGSDRGQAGVLIGVLVVGTLVAVERAFFSTPLRAALTALGFGRPTGRGLIVAIAVCAMLLLIVPLFGQAAGVSFTYWPSWTGLVPGFLHRRALPKKRCSAGISSVTCGADRSAPIDIRYEDFLHSCRTSI